MGVFLIELGIPLVFIGALGFRSSGLPFSDHKNLKGTPGKVIGGICLAVGIGLIICFIVLNLINLLTE